MAQVDYRWKNPQGASNGQMYLWAQDLTKTLRKGTPLPLRSFADAKLDFGAKFDGTTDDSTAINFGISQLSANGGGILFCPPGTVQINSTINMKRGVSVIGAGASVWPHAYLGFGNGVTRFLFGGTSGTTFFDFGNAWNGTLENCVFDGNFLGGKILNLGAPQNSVFRNIVVRKSTFVANSGAIHMTTDGQTDPSNAQIVSAAFNLFDTVMVEDVGGHCMWLRGTLDGSNNVIGAVTLNTFLNCTFDNSNPTGQIALAFDQAADTNTFIGGRVLSGHTGTGVLLNQSTVNSALGGVNFYGTAIENADATGTAIDARNNSWPNNLYGCFLGGPGTSVVLTNGVAPGKVKLWGSYLATGQYFPNISQPAVGASPWTYTNLFPYAVELQLFGGTITQIQQKRNGVANNWNAGNAVNVAFLEPSDALIVTYTAAPTAQVIPH